MKNILLLGVIVLLASVYLFAATNASACARSNVAPTVSNAPPAGRINPDPLAGPGNAVPAKSNRMSLKFDGLYIPVPKGSDVTFGYISKGPVTLLDGAAVLDESGNVLDKKPVLKTVGKVLLHRGLLIGSKCSEHLRLNDAIRNGAIQNVGDYTVDLPLSDGAIVRLRPGDGVFINDDEPWQGQRAVVGPNYRFLCRCTCAANTGSHENDADFDCSSPDCTAAWCRGQNGTDCITTVDSDGKLRDCSRVAVAIQPVPV